VGTLALLEPLLRLLRRCGCLLAGEDCAVPPHLPAKEQQHQKTGRDQELAKDTDN
jgi:hypothetical protein